MTSETRWCASCGGEFRSWVLRCPDCETPLSTAMPRPRRVPVRAGSPSGLFAEPWMDEAVLGVRELPSSGRASGRNDWVCVFQHDPSEAAKVLGALAEAGIDAEISVPAAAVGNPGSLTLVRVWVRPQDEDAALEHVPGGPVPRDGRGEDYGRPPHVRWGLVYAGVVLATIASACLAELMAVLTGSELTDHLATTLACFVGLLAGGGIVVLAVREPWSTICSVYGFGRRHCPQCGLTIRRDVVVCRFCDAEVPPA